MNTIYSEMLNDLWLQKYRLRLANIQLNYPRPRKIVEKNDKGKDVEVKIYRTYIIENAELDRKTGERGILAVQFRDDIPKDPKKRKKMEDEIAVEEKMMMENGYNYKKIVVPTEFLDNYRYQVKMANGAVMRKSLGVQQASIIEKVGLLQKLFPEVYVLMKDDLYEQFARSYGDNPAKALRKLSELKAAKAQMQRQAAAADAAARGNGPTPGDQETPPAPAGAPNPAPVAAPVPAGAAVATK